MNQRYNAQVGSHLGVYRGESINIDHVLVEFESCMQKAFSQENRHYNEIRPNLYELNVLDVNVGHVFRLEAGHPHAAKSGDKPRNLDLKYFTF